ncbi:MAG TPA: ImmA/IrrE family metallo-endopeptidase [Pseudonocardiaceae bacterium]|nr:ImmA/IrrE family metallo-endopeptidase [Pseudonocardiaceae bacterium]
MLTSKTPLLTRLVELIPTLRIAVLDKMPVDSTSFWGNQHWHIHIHAGRLPSFHHFAALHELKHIIDHPLRQRLTTFTDADWETVADYFAAQVLTPALQIRFTRLERRNTYEPSQ